MHYVGISTYQFVPYYASAVHKHTHTRNLKPFEDSELTGLKVDIAERSRILILICTIRVLRRQDPTVGVGFAVYVYVDCSRLSWAFLSAVSTYMTVYMSH